VQNWHLPSVQASGRRDPQVLFSTPECRAVVIDLRAGEELGEHQVRERAVVQVVTGEVTVGSGSGSQVRAGAGTLVCFEPGERHTVRAEEDSRVLLLLAPWPGAGHYPAGGDADPRRMPRNATAPPA
jgi:quercetin dioxygenase-like cupin family protein